MLILCILLILVTTGVLYILIRGMLGSSSSRHQTNSRHHGISIYKTQIIKCGISHRRLIPKDHGFAYPYLAVGIPVRSPDSNWLLSVDHKQWWERDWLHVTPKDHLNRGNSGNTLSQNLDAYLKQQVIFAETQLSPPSTKGLQLTHLPSTRNSTQRRFHICIFLPPRASFTKVAALCRSGIFTALSNI